MLAFALLMMAVQLVGQQASKSVVIYAGHVLDVKTGKLLSDQTIIIEDGKILSIESATGTGSGNIKLLASEPVRIELPNATVLPGLIDAHTHLTSNPTFGYEELAISIPREALIGAKNARV